MPEREAPNPERRSDSAVLCLSLGIGITVLAWVFGAGGAIAALLAGGTEAQAGALVALLALPLLMFGGTILALIGTIWIIARVIADSREADAKERYRNVER